jgi:hypothetical protein
LNLKFFFAQAEIYFVTAQLSAGLLFAGSKVGYTRQHHDRCCRVTSGLVFDLSKPSFRRSAKADEKDHGKHNPVLAMA